MNFLKPKLNKKVKKSEDRGYVSHGWLESYHSFSFSGYYDAAHMHYSVLRVINEDVIQPQHGFDLHPHKNMEIITYMLAGELQHEDNMGNVSVIKAGDVQCMTAGSGVEHSEYNSSSINSTHLLQIWIFPERKLLPPSYSEKSFSTADKLNHWCLIVSHDGREGSLKIHQDISLYATVLSTGSSLDYTLLNHRSVYIQVASGEVELCGQRLSAGDALMADGTKAFKVTAIAHAELLLFDLPLHDSIDMHQQ